MTTCLLICLCLFVWLLDHGEYEDPSVKGGSGPTGLSRRALEFSCSGTWEGGSRSPGVHPFMLLALDV